MRTDPNWSLADDEVAQILADDPSLAGELAEFDRAYQAGEVELISDDVVRSRLQSRGLHLAPRPSDPTTR